MKTVHKPDLLLRILLICSSLLALAPACTQTTGAKADPDAQSDAYTPSIADIGADIGADIELGDAKGGDVDLLAVLSDPAGCKTFCKPDAPCYIICGPQKTTDELWTPACASEIKRFTDGKQTGDYCYDPPKKWCAGGGGLAMTKACSADGSQCCEFGTTCIPCDWKACKNGVCQTNKGPMSTDDPNVISSCPDPHPDWRIRVCVLCGDVVVCPSKSTK